MMFVICKYMHECRHANRHVKRKTKNERSRNCAGVGNRIIKDVDVRRLRCLLEYTALPVVLYMENMPSQSILFSTLSNMSTVARAGTVATFVYCGDFCNWSLFLLVNSSRLKNDGVFSSIASFMQLLHFSSGSAFWHASKTKLCGSFLGFLAQDIRWSNDSKIRDLIKLFFD